jgi:hypothetical protein
MFRFLIRSGVVALFVLSLSAPAQALPLGEAEAGSFEATLAEIWERLAAEVVSLWTDGGTTSLLTNDGRGACDPNGGLCDS